jgi:surface protein
MYLTNSKLLRRIKSFDKYQSFLLFSLLFVVSSFDLSAQNFQLASNNKTITCDGASVNSTGVVNGKTYTKVNRSTLVTMITNGDDLSCVCTSGITDMSSLFNNKNTTYDISSWDTSDATNMQGIFQNSGSLANSDPGYWDVSSLQDQNSVNNMFDGTDMTQDLSYWCFPSRIPTQNSTNYWGNNNAYRTNSSIRPRWNGNCRTAKVAPAPSGSNSPATLTITSNDSDNVITSGQVTLTATFSINMNASPTISIAGVVTNVSMTQSATAAVWTYYWQVPSSISSGTTVNVTATATDTNSLPYSGNASLTLTISPTFYLASNGVTIKCSGCSAGDTGMVSGTTYTAHDNTSLANKSRTDTDWDRVVTTLVTDMSGLFDGLVSQNQTFNQNLSSWDTSNVTDMSGMFKAANSLSSANQNFNSWDTSKVTDMSYMFESTDYMNPQIDSWDVSSVTNMESMFQDCRLIGYNNSNQAIGSWDVSSVTSMRVMFNRTDYFNIDIGSWDTSSVTDMTSMFYNALVFNQNIGGWDTSNVTDTQAMFNGARQFNQDLNSWDVSKVTTMNSMFKSAPIFNGNISSWNTSSVTDMRQMFDSASRFNQDIGNWNVSSVSNEYSMGSMFQSAGDFVQDISGWCVSQISTEPNNFKNSAGTNSWNSDTSKHPQWGVCNSNVTVTLTDTDTDNLLASSDTLTITASFTEAMTATPTISITGVVTNVAMLGGTASFTYNYTWDVDSGGTPSSGAYYATVAGTASATGGAYSGTESITFTLDTTAPTVTLTSTDSDNVVNVSQVVTITAGFSEAMTATPTISITGIVTNVIMTPVSGTNSYTYAWDTSSGTLSEGTYSATVSGTDLIGNPYVAGTQSITFTVDSSTPTVTITSNDPDNTIKPGDNITVTVTFNEPMASGPTISITGVVTNVALTATNSTTFTYSWNTSGVSAGSYTVTVTGTDLAGNTYAGSDSMEITLDSTPPIVILSDTDDDNFLAASDTVTITAAFSEAMTLTPTISISGTSISNQVMTKISGGSGSGSHTLLGADIDGEAASDYTTSVSFSSDGSRVAIGAYANDGKGSDSGHVRIYDYNGSAWVQVGADIDGEAANDYSGYSVSLSSDGSRVAIGAHNNDGNGSNSGHVRIYDYNGSAWVQVGADIDGEAADDKSGDSVSLSSDGSRVAIGAYNNDGGGSNSGHVRIYDYNGSAWVQVGADIDGEAAGDRSGQEVSLSSDGSRLAIGAVNNGGNGANSGHVRIFDYTPSGTSSWTQVGADIDGEATSDYSASSISLSSDGSRVAIGAEANDGNGSNSGHVRIYDYNGTAWVQVGEDIDGEAAGDQTGSSVSLSSDGSRVAIGAYANDGNGSNSGHVRIFDYNGSAWVQVGADIDGEQTGDYSGMSSVISSDGSRVAIGAQFNNNGNGISSGHVRIYTLSPGESYQYAWDVDNGNNSAPSDGTYRATIAGADLAGNAYSGTDSITFTLDTTAPTVTLTDTDADNLVSTSEVVTITAGFSEAMTATPTISITGIVTSVIMTPVSGTNSYTFAWDTSSGTLSEGTYSATVSGTDLIGNPYVAGTQSITFRVDSSNPTVTITTNDPVIIPLNLETI